MNSSLPKNAAQAFAIGGLSSSSFLYFIAKHFDQGLICLPSQTALSLDDCKNALRHFLHAQGKATTCYIYPELDATYSSVGGDPHRSFQRILAQVFLASHKSEKVFILTTATALSQKVLAPKDILKSVLSVKKGDWIERNEITSEFKRLGYRRDEIAEDQGFYSIRGHLIDVFPMNSSKPLRMEFFGDEVISIRHYDPETQRSLSEIEKFDFIPIRELMISDKNREAGKTNLKNFGDAKGVSRDEREQILWELENQKDLFEYRWLLPAFYPDLVEPSSYLPTNLPVILVDPEKLQSEVEEDLRSTETDFEEFNKLAYPPSAIRQLPDILYAPTNHRLWTNISALGENYQSLGFEDLRHRLTRAKSFEPLRQILEESRDAGNKISLVFKNERKKNNLIESFAESFPEISWEEADLFPGFHSKTLQKTLITERDLFGTKKRRSASGSQIDASKFLREFGDLQIGDYIVHDDHGIGKYQGLIPLNVGQVSSEFVLIEYADQDKLYLPIYKVDKISRYVRGDGFAHPKLDRLGSQSFIKRKSKAKKDIFQIAHELIEIAAQRKLFPVDRPNIDEQAFQELTYSFGFELTPDQDSAIRDTLDDLQKPYPMDRLVCGDVGFGKTEVALRAAMFRLLQGTQVAILAPTTLLVEQHFRNFKKRFAGTKFRVERLSRFVSSSEQKKIVQDLVDGKIDLVIGTHRLLQRDLKFKNLGMLIVDEEQRFGVKHKERIKKLRTNIDILTLSATPIPRTLQMSIVGIRELSLIVTPPETREAVSTYVGSFDEKLIREKIMREIDRGGQVFFVHNRVRSIHKIHEQLQAILPEVKMTVAHGQMPEEELENKMLGFMEKEYDLLIATSIIENGIDVPNANTLFVDHAEHFGLSDLYQLRGRVGRGYRKAYSFFLIRDETPITADASKRLQVLQSCTELGSGFRVATHDLEIRGAGNLLGEAQSGVISEIGLELYNQMLHETLEDIRSGGLQRNELPEVKPGYSAYIPENYIPDPSVRISTYRRLNQVQELQELLAFEDELLDRFGLYPKELEVLCHIARLRILAAKLRTKELECSPGKMILELRPDTPLDPHALLKRPPAGIHFDPKGRLVFSFESAFQNPLKQKETRWQHPELYDLHQSQELLKKLIEFKA